MKKIAFLILTSFLISFSTCCAQTKALTRAEKRAAKEALIEAKVKEIIESNCIKIVIDRIMPATSPARSSLDGYALQISNDTLNCHLPYIGQFKSSVFDTSGMSIEFENQVIKPSKAFGKKGVYQIVFETKSQKNLELFVFNIEIYSNGSSVIAIAPQGRDHIVYHGNLKY